MWPSWLHINCNGNPLGWTWPFLWAARWRRTQDVYSNSSARHVKRRHPRTPLISTNFSLHHYFRLFELSPLCPTFIVTSILLSLLLLSAQVLDFSCNIYEERSRDKRNISRTLIYLFSEWKITISSSYREATDYVCSQPCLLTFKHYSVSSFISVAVRRFWGSQRSKHHEEKRE